jgi:hypothetical protein
VASPRTKRRLRRAMVLPAAIALTFALAGNAFANVPLTTVGTDPFTNTSSYHKTQVEPDSYSFGNTIVFTYQGGGRFTDGGSDDIGWASSQDNGATWTFGELPSTTVYSTPPGPWDRISDPSVAYDPQDGTWMIASLSLTGTTGKAVLVSRSFDQGLTWQAPVTVSLGGGGSFYDKSWIACDTTSTSAFYGNCYVEWDDAFQGNALKMSRSTDGGVTWSSSTISGSGVIGGQPVVQPNGTVILPITANGLQAWRSTNGGSSYTGPVTISTIQTHFVAGGLRDGGGLVSAEIDGAGKVYVAWQDCRFRSGCSSNDIVMSTSTDGLTWTPVVRIPIDPVTSTFDHFIPGIGVDHSTSGATAHIGLAFYLYPKTSCTFSTCKLAGGFVESTDGGTTWTSIIKVFGTLQLKTLPSTTGGYMVGDYISTSFNSAGQAFPIFANTHSQSTCTLGQITSCNEFMVTPTGGLAPQAGTIPVGHDKVVYLAGAARPVGTAF